MTQPPKQSWEGYTRVTVSVCAYVRSLSRRYPLNRSTFRNQTCLYFRLINNLIQKRKKLKQSEYRWGKTQRRGSWRMSCRSYWPRQSWPMQNEYSISSTGTFSNCKNSTVYAVIPTLAPPAPHKTTTTKNPKNPKECVSDSQGITVSRLNHAGVALVMYIGYEFDTICDHWCFVLIRVPDFCIQLFQAFTFESIIHKSFRSFFFSFSSGRHCFFKLVHLGVCAACNVVFINTVDTESLTGPQAIAKAIKATIDSQPVPKTTVVHFKVSSQGITLTDNNRKWGTWDPWSSFIALFLLLFLCVCTCAMKGFDTVLHGEGDRPWLSISM